ncbi:MAG: hypothetical protein Q8J72_04875 [Rhodocyclaceae bacterium]|nr:hypothetical protein [Rhodocyclaceae bacterium]
MASALLDNATLTAVQRITGQAPTRSSDSVDVDLVAFENYIQARLFYDDVVVIDDYLPQHREARRAAFPQLGYVTSEDFKLQELSAAADAASDAIHPKIQGGDFANPEFKALFKLLQTHMVCTWDISSSIYHLNLKVLAARNTQDFDKYGAVATAMFNELSDASRSGRRIKNDVELVDRYGNPIGNGYTIPDAKWGNGESGPPSGAIQAFSASLVWVANRAMYYTLAAAHLKADVFLYPIRQAYQQHYLAQNFKYDANFPKRLVSQFSATLSRDIAEIHNGGTLAIGAVDLPVFSAWLANSCGDPVAALHALEDIRLQNEFVEAREQVSELREIYNDGSISDANKKIGKMTASISKVSAAMREKYSIKTQQGVPLTRLVTVYNAFALLKGLPPLPKIDLSVKLPQFLRDMKREVGFSAVYRNIMNDLATFGALGQVRDVLCRRVELEDNAVAYTPKAEDPKYRHAHSKFKSPM